MAQLSRNNIEMLFGTASFVDPHIIRVTSSRGPIDYQAETVVIATGTKPAVSAKVPINGRNIINSDQILQMPRFRKTLIVVGGGVIGVEYTCMFATLGRARDPGGETAAAAGVRRCGNCGGAVLSSARQSRDAAAERRGVERGGNAGRQRGGESGEQEEALGRRAALRGRPAGQCGRTEPGSGRASKPIRAGASRWTRISAPSSRTFSRWAT